MRVEALLLLRRDAHACPYLARTEIFLLTLPAREGRLLHWLYEHADVIERSEEEDGSVKARVRIASEKKPLLLSQLRQAGIALP